MTSLPHGHVTRHDNTTLVLCQLTHTRSRVKHSKLILDTAVFITFAFQVIVLLAAIRIATIIALALLYPLPAFIAKNAFVDLASLHSLVEEFATNPPQSRTTIAHDASRQYAMNYCYRYSTRSSTGSRIRIYLCPHESLSLKKGEKKKNKPPTPPSFDSLAGSRTQLSRVHI